MRFLVRFCELYRGTVVADGFAVYDVLARADPTFTLAECWSHAKHTLCETAKLAGIDPHAYLLRALYASIAQPGTVIYPGGSAMPSNRRV